MDHPPTLVRAAGKPDRLVVVFSDIEMGAPGAVDDFPHAAWLGALIASYADARYESLEVDLVFNGDTFDLLKTSVDGVWSRHVSARLALAKMRIVAESHLPFFAGIREFCARKGPSGGVYFVLGNHDPELVFPEVQEYLRELCASGDQIRFPGFALDFGRLHIEHGSQQDRLFQVNPKRPTMMHQGEEIVSLSWGAVALLEAAIPLQPLLYHHDRLKPRKLLFELMPEVKQLLTGAFWNYWTGSYFRGWAGDPVKQVSWTMLKELVYRLFSLDPEISAGVESEKLLIEHPDCDVYLYGHLHVPGWWSFGNRKVLRTGAMRDEFMLSERGDMLRPVNKTYAEVFLSGNEVVRSQLVETVPPPRPPGTTPRSIFDVLPEVRRRLAPPEARSKQQNEQRAQEAKEAREAEEQG